MTENLQGRRDALDFILDTYSDKQFSRLRLLLESLTHMRAKQKRGAQPTQAEQLKWDAEFQKFTDAQGEASKATIKLKPLKDRLTISDVVPANKTPNVSLGKAFDQILKLEPEREAFELTDDQKNAWAKLVAWLPTDSPYFVLKGVAGSGKSYLMTLLLELDGNFKFTAPTNKAAKVLADFLDCETKTIYSLLGLRMTAEEDKLVLKHHSFPDLGNNPIVVVDEAGQIPKFMVAMFKELVAKGWRFIFVGDPFQWNPIGESESPVWKLAEKKFMSMMTEVKRFDNQLLKLSIKIRKAIKEENFKRSPIKDDNDGDEGVFVMSQKEMLAEIRSLSVDDWKTTKVICWRNKTVAKYNRYIRKHLGLKDNFDVRDLILTGGPVTIDGEMIAFTDEEFQVSSVNERTFSITEGPIEATVLGLQDKYFSLYVPKNPEHLQTILSSRAAKASNATGRERKVLWTAFWHLKNMFHEVRPGFALTSHRVQGTTLENAFLDQEDMLANSDSAEAFRGLYVGATRPKKKLITF